MYYLNAYCKILIYVLFSFHGENKNENIYRENENEMKNKHTNKQTT